MEARKKGIIYILISSLFFAMMSAAVKSVPDIPLAQKVFIRNAIGLIAVIISLHRSGTSVKPNRMDLMIMRSLFGVSGVALYFTSLSRLQLSDAVILNKLSPIFVIVLSMIFLKERINRLQVISIFIALGGAALVVKPELNYSMLPAIFGLGASLCAASAYTVIRKASAFDAPKVIVFYFCLISSLLTMPFMMAGQFKMPSGFEWIGLLMVGLCAYGGQIFMTTAYSYAPASEVSIYSYSMVVFSLLFGVIFWSEIPDVISLAGSALIILGGYLNFRAKLPRAAQRKSA